MKKYLALLLSLVLVLGLFAGCGSSTETTTDADTSTAAEETTEAETETETEAAEETTSEDAAADAETTSDSSSDFVWNGQMEVWSILPTTGAEGLVLINDAMGAMMEAEGFTYVKKDSQGNPTNQVSFVEDAIAAGNVGCLMIAAMDVDLLEDVVAQAVDAGIAVAMLGADPDYEIAGNVYTAYSITGMFAVQAAEDWVTQRVAEGGDIPTNADGKYEVACDIYTDIRDGVYRSNAVIGTLENSDTLVRVATTTSYGESAYNDAYNNAQDVLGANPDCHIFIAYEPEEAMGAADAIADYCSQNGYDLADYCVIPCYAEDSTFLEMYDEVCADASANAIKGYSTYGDPAETDADGNVIKDSSTLTGEHLGEILLGVCGVGDYSWEYGVTYYDTVTSTNIYGYEAIWTFGEENPAAEYEVSEFIG